MRRKITLNVNNDNDDSIYYNNICMANGKDSNKAKYKTKFLCASER